MEHNTLQTVVTISDEMNGLETLMKNKLGSWASDRSDNCCIYKVPDFIREGNEELYRPSVMSIGPAYYQDPKLETMQEVKWIYLNSFLENPDNANPNLEHYINFIKEKEELIRDCYQEQNSLLRDEFVEMIVLDAAFLVYYFMCESSIHSLDSPFIKNKLQGLLPYLQKDLFLLDNQIPFFVLNGMYNIAFGQIVYDDTPASFPNFALEYIGRTGIPGYKAIKSIIVDKKITDASLIKHLVDLRRMSCCLSLNLPLREKPDKKKRTGLVSYMHKEASFIKRLILYGRKYLTKDNDGNCHLAYSAQQLQHAGVKFVASESENPLHISFAHGTLKISKLNIEDNTEPSLRSIIFFEQCHYSKDSYFIDYIVFLDELIDTVEDVEVLTKNKVIKKHLGCDEDVINLFNNIGKNINLECKFYYSDVNKALNDYASTRWNRWMAVLRRKYFCRPWAIISVIAGFIFFVLTALQTYADFAYRVTSESDSN